MRAIDHVDRLRRRRICPSPSGLTTRSHGWLSRGIVATTLRSRLHACAVSPVHSGRSVGALQCTLPAACCSRQAVAPMRFSQRDCFGGRRRNRFRPAQPRSARCRLGLHDLGDLSAAKPFDIRVVTTMRNCSGSACIAALISLSGKEFSACSSADASGGVPCRVAQLPIGDFGGRICPVSRCFLRSPLMYVLIRIRFNHALRWIPRRNEWKPGVGLHDRAPGEVLASLMMTRHPRCPGMRRLAAGRHHVRTAHADLIGR